MVTISWPLRNRVSGRSTTTAASIGLPSWSMPGTRRVSRGSSGSGFSRKSVMPGICDPPGSRTSEGAGPGRSGRLAGADGLAPEDVEAAADDDGGADDDPFIRPVAEQEQAEDHGPDHPRIVERRHDVRGRQARGLDQAEMADAHEQAEPGHHAEVDGARRDVDLRQD